MLKIVPADDSLGIVLGATAAVVMFVARDPWQGWRIYKICSSNFMATIGVLALQGGFQEHVSALQRLSREEGIPINVRLLKKPQDMVDVQGLVIPGGESTTMNRLASTTGLAADLKLFISTGKPTMGTCAGLIMLADQIEGSPEPILGGLGITCRRNYYGTQLDSFIANNIYSTVNDLGRLSCKGIFIRAPAITKVGDAQVLAKHGNDVVAVRTGSIIGLTFHPELTDDLTWHRYFLTRVLQNSK